jgi:hypothetical protein
MNTLMNKVKQDNSNDIEDLHGYSMKKFGGILAKQRLNFADELEIKTRLGPIPAQIDSVRRSNSMSFSKSKFSSGGEEWRVEE